MKNNCNLVEISQGVVEIDKVEIAKKKKGEKSSYEKTVLAILAFKVAI